MSPKIVTNNDMHTERQELDKPFQDIDVRYFVLLIKRCAQEHLMYRFSQA